MENPGHFRLLRKRNMKSTIRFGLVIVLLVICAGTGFAAVTRSIANFNCPANTRVTFQLSGGTTFYGIYEYIPNTWTVNLAQSSPTPSISSYGSDNQLQIGASGTSSSAWYTVAIPNSNNYDSAYNNNPHVVTKGEYPCVSASTIH